MRRFAKARRRVPGQMNGLERAYADQLNEMLKAGRVREWKYEAIGLVIARPPKALASRYHPDFFVVNADGEVEFHECKGGIFMDDAKVKLKAAAEQYPFRFVLVQKRPKRDGGGFTFEEF